MQFTVSPDWDGQLLRAYLTDKVGLSHRLLSRLKQKENGITLCGAPVTVRATVHTGDVIDLAIEDEPVSHPLPPSTPAEVIYEDESLLVCNKSGDMPTHPSLGHYDDTLANAVAAYDQAAARPARPFRPVNRLDRQTSGVVLVARSAMAGAKLSEAMSNRQITKCYLAIVDGVPVQDSGHVRASIRRAKASIILREICPIEAQGAQAAHTEYRVLSVWTDERAPTGRRALLLAIPHTGRTHQLRLHFDHLGTPIAGDGLYGPYADAPTASRQLLHAALLRFPHPDTGALMTLCAPLPEDMLSLLPTHLQPSFRKEQMSDTLCRCLKGEQL